MRSQHNSLSINAMKQETNGKEPPYFSGETPTFPCGECWLCVYNRLHPHSKFSKISNFPKFNFFKISPAFDFVIAACFIIPHLKSKICHFPASPLHYLHFRLYRCTFLTFSLTSLQNLFARHSISHSFDQILWSDLAW